MSWAIPTRVTSAADAAYSAGAASGAGTSPGLSTREAVQPIVEIRHEAGQLNVLNINHRHLNRWLGQRHPGGSTSVGPMATAPVTTSTTAGLSLDEARRSRKSDLRS